MPVWLANRLGSKSAELKQARRRQEGIDDAKDRLRDVAVDDDVRDRLRDKFTR
jgi:hypothetical protein